MRFTVPESCVRTNSGAGHKICGQSVYDPGLYRWTLGLNPGYFEEEIEDPGYFWCTHEHEFNDVVHSKVLSGDGQVTIPMLYDKQNWAYFTSYHRLGMQCFSYDEPIDICGYNIVVESLGDWGYIAEVGTGRGGFYASLQCYFYEHKTKKLWRYGKGTSQHPCPEAIVYCTRTSKTVFDPESRVNDTYVTYTETGRVDVYADQNGFASAIAGHLQSATSNVWKSTRPLGARKDKRAGWIHNPYPNILDAMRIIAFQMHSSLFNRETLKVDYRDCTFVGYPKVYKPTIPPDALSVSKRFIFHEIELFKNRTDPYLVSAGQDLSQYWLNVLKQQAYLDALQSVPRLNDNSISNIIEIAGFIKSLVVDHRIEIPKSLSSAWLSYRYVYTTGKLDAEEAIDFVNRRVDLGSLDKWIQCFGVSHVEYQPKGWSSPIPVTCRCCLDIRPTHLAMLGKIWRALYTYGLQPSFYVIWDMIPYSFIVDWLLPIGKLASVLDAERMYSETYYEIRNVQFSLSYDTRDEKYGDIYHQYTRFLSPGGVTLNGFYFFEEDPVSTKVVGYRVLDSLSLIIGRRK